LYTRAIFIRTAWALSHDDGPAGTVGGGSDTEACFSNLKVYYLEGGQRLIRSDVRCLVQSFLLSFTIFVLFISPLLAEPNERRLTKLADGVYAIEHKNLNDGNPSGNTTVIIGEREVFVVDSCYRPSSAAEDIAQIRQWTDKPVGYLFNTHFHNDHNNGNKTYLNALPSLAIIAQEETKKDMDLIQPGAEPSYQI
jgi:hypothetical protein